MPSPPSSPTWPTTIHPSSSLTPTTPTTAQSSSSTFIPVSPHNLFPWINDKSALIVDIRPHGPYSAARIPTSLCLSVPSTLLKRPLYALERLADMLPSQSARQRFLAWPNASRILVYDTDTTVIMDTSNIMGLLRKFQKNGFSGQLAWLRGGYQAVWRERKDLIDATPLMPEAEMDEGDDHSSSTALRPRQLPATAFSLSSTTAASPFNLQHRRLAGGAVRVSGVGGIPESAVISTNDSTPAMPMAMSMSISLPLPHSVLSASRQKTAFNPFFDAIRQNLELSQGITERIPLRLPAHVRKRLQELPFPWLQHIARRAAPSSNGAFDEHIAPGEGVVEFPLDARANDSLVEEGAEALAMQFYRIELAEQRRLQGVMEYHSKESGRILQFGEDCKQEDWFPFSIAAGVEKGTKNRYRHIWPFEHARVKLHRARASDDDYVNASYVQPLGTKKRYIATQGPMAATFVDFWTLCWEQNVHVIVMLTTETEGSVIKCGNYWNESNFGPLRLKLVSQTGGGCIHQSEVQRPQMTEEAGFFASGLPQSSSLPFQNHSQTCRCEASTTIKRTFELSHTQYPEAGTRKVIQLQYLEWPDMNVPDDASGILGLMKAVESAVKESGGRWGCLDEEEGNPSRLPSTKTSQNASRVKVELDPRTGVVSHFSGSDGPVLLHCSAGVGRTGGFIAVDAVLDGIRRELRKVLNKETHRAPRSDYREASSSPTNFLADGDISAPESKDSGDIDMASSPPPSSPVADADETPTLPPPQFHHSLRMTIERENTLRPDAENKDEVMEGILPSEPPQFEALRRGPSRGRGGVDMSQLTSRWLKSIQAKTARNTPLLSQANTLPTLPTSIPVFQLSPATATFNFDAPIEQNAGVTYPLPSTSGSTSSGASIFEDSSFYLSDRPRISSLNTSASGQDSPKEIFPSINAQSHPKSNLGSAVLSESQEGVEQAQLAVGDKDTRPVPYQLHLPIAKTLSMHPTLSETGQVASPLAKSTSWAEKCRQRAVSAPAPSSLTQGEDSSAEAHQGLDQNTQERVGNVVTLFGGGEQQALDESRPGRREQSLTEGVDKSSVPPPPPLLSEAALPSTYPDNAFILPFSSQKQFTVEKNISPVASLPVPVSQGEKSAQDVPQLHFLPSKSRSLPTETPLDHYYTPFPMGPISEIRSSPDGTRFTSFDYKQPRPLHEDATPIWLSSYEDPILEVVQDLREQRMSLCQSLRQYVFVHAVVIEGALAILDEERRKKEENELFSHQVPPSNTKPASSAALSQEVNPLSAGDKENIPLHNTSSPVPPLPMSTSPSTSTWPSPQVFLPHPPINLSLPIMKRSASPTELIKEGKAGETLFSKRPSIKRQQTNGAEPDREVHAASSPLSPSIKAQLSSREHLD